MTERWIAPSVVVVNAHLWFGIGGSQYGTLDVIS